MRPSLLSCGLVLVLISGTRSALAQQAAPPLTQAQIEANFVTASAALEATAAGTEQRAQAAEKARQMASDLGWISFQAGNYTGAATWFERASTLKKEQVSARRAYLEHSLATDVPAGEAAMDANFAKWTKQAAESEPLKKKVLLNAVGMLKRERLTVRYGVVSQLESVTREANDDAGWLKYEEEELRIRRAELKTLTELGAPADEVAKQNARIAKAMEGVAWAQEEAGRLDEAEKNNLAALTLRQSLPATLTERSLGDAFEAVGYFYLFYRGDLTQARGYYEKALIELDKSTALELKDWESGKPYTPAMIAAMKPDERKEYEARHADSKTAILAAAATSQALYLADLSFVQRKLGNYQGAIDFATRSLKVEDTLPNTKEPWFVLIRATIRAQGLGILNNLHAATGDFATARQELDECIGIRRELGDNSNTANALQQAGALLLGQDKFDEARPYLEQAHQLYAAAQGLDGVISTSDALARLNRDAGQLDDASVMAAQALELARKTGIVTTVAAQLRTSASVKLRQNLPEEASQLLAEAQTLDARNVSVTDKIRTLDLQGQTLEAQKQNDAALVKYREAVALLEGVRSTTPSQANFSNLKTNYQIYERLVRLLVQSGKGEEAFDYLSRAKSKQLQDTLSLASVQSADPKIRAKIDSATTLDAKLHAIVDQLQSELAKPAGEQNAAKIRSLQLVRAQTQGEFFSVLDDLKKSGSKFDVRVEPADVKAIQKRIPTDAALVQYVPLGDKLYIFLFTRTSLKIIETSTNPQQVWDLVKQVRPQLSREGAAGRGAKLASAVAPAPVATSKIEDNLTTLYDLLIAPIETDVADKGTLAFIPTQWLYYLPMQVLAKKQNGQLRYLIQDKNVVYLATTGQINRAMEPRDSADLGKGLLAFGDPTGADLPAAQVEVNTIGQVFPGSTIYSGAQVIKTAVVNDKNWDSRILHFATHGILNSAEPDESYIQLSPGKTADDGELTVKEIQNLPLDKVDVVTLSACQTALGENEPGREVMTLAGAFERAGAYSIVASLWSVSDDSTKDLMVEFYTELAAGKSKAEAIRLAQLKVLGAPDFAAPYFWAPFILMGDWR